MSKDPLPEVVHLCKQRYRPFAEVRDLLRQFLQTAITVTRSQEGEICFKAPDRGIDDQTNAVVFAEGMPCQAGPSLRVSECALCKVFLEDNYGDFLRLKESAGEKYCVRLPLPAKSSLAVPVRYQGASLGVIALASKGPNHYTDLHVSACQWLATETAYHLKRYQLRENIRAIFGKDLMFVGMSDALRRIDEFIERASKTNLPALILGEFGSEKRQVAYALHLGGRSGHPFVELRCAALDPSSFKQTIADRLRKAAGGTVFFNGIDELDSQLQSQLCDVIELETEHWDSTPGRQEPLDVRLMASASKELDELAAEREFCRPLLEKFDFLLTQLAPLKRRQEDIKLLAEYFLAKHVARRHLSFSTEVLEAFETYDWPRNVYELERVVARLAVMAEEDVITMQDLRLHSPEVMRWSEGPRIPVPRNDERTQAYTVREEKIWPAGKYPKGIDTSKLVHALMKGQWEEIKNFHPALESALKYIAENLHDGISLHDLARHACLSASHLAYLFQKTIGVNFKLFLAMLRIEEAKQLLQEKPHMRITEISFQVGFGDLRHFERTFRRLVGLSPRDYRHRVLELQEPSLSS